MCVTMSDLLVDISCSNTAYLLSPFEFLPGSSPHCSTFRPVLFLHEQAPLLVRGPFVEMQSFQCQGLSAADLAFPRLPEYPLVAVS